MRTTKTGIGWIDAFVEQADNEGVPETIDLESGRRLYSSILLQDVPMSIYRRLPIPYRVVHDRPRQRPGDVIAYAKQLFAEAPVLLGSVKPGRMLPLRIDEPHGRAPAAKRPRKPKAT
jgi:hypothetical protein